MHVACNKRNMLFLRYLFSLKHKEEVLLHKLVIKFSTVSIVEIRFVNINIVSLNRVSYVNVGATRAYRGSSCS
jgi:hypothetical protein